MNVFQFVTKNKPILLAWILALIAIVVSVVLWIITLVRPANNDFCDVVRYYEAHPEKCTDTKVEGIDEYFSRSIKFNERGGMVFDIRYESYRVQVFYSSVVDLMMSYSFDFDVIYYTDYAPDYRFTPSRITYEKVSAIRKIAESCLNVVLTYDNVVDRSGSVITANNVFYDFFRYGEYRYKMIIVSSCISAVVVGWMIAVVIMTSKMKKSSLLVQNGNKFDGEQIVDDMAQKTLETLLSFCKQKVFASTKKCIRVKSTRFERTLYIGEVFVGAVPYNAYGYAEIKDMSVKKALIAAIYNNFISRCEADFSSAEKERCTLVKLHKYYNLDDGNGLNKLDVAIGLVGRNDITINILHNPY